MSVLLGEMFPDQMRGSALAVAVAPQWLANFAVSFSFPWLAENIGLPITYSAYTLFAVLSYLFVQMAVPETNEIEQTNG